MHKRDILDSITLARRANAKSGIISQEEFSKIESVLLAVEKERAGGTFKIVPGVDEDIHTANEWRLGEIIGKDVAGNLHTGRSRNEQIATYMLMWLHDEMRKLEGYLVSFHRLRAAARPAASAGATGCCRTVSVSNDLHGSARSSSASTRARSAAAHLPGTRLASTGT